MHVLAWRGRNVSELALPLAGGNPRCQRDEDDALALALELSRMDMYGGARGGKSHE